LVAAVCPVCGTQLKLATFSAASCHTGLPDDLLGLFGYSQISVYANNSAGFFNLMKGGDCAVLTAFNMNYCKKKLFSLNSSVTHDNYDTYKTADIEINQYANMLAGLKVLMGELILCNAVKEIYFIFHKSDEVQKIEKSIKR
jgi:hypothetical protein